MRTIQTTIYTFNELSDKAKDKARAYFRETIEYSWLDESMDSVRAFCDTFNVSVKDYSIGTYGYSYIKTDATNQNFRGLKLKDVNRDAMPTGYCLDCTLWETFYDEFKKYGDALAAFKIAISAAVRAIVADMEYQHSDEYLDEFIEGNDYEFTEDGKLH